MSASTVAERVDPYQAFLGVVMRHPDVPAEWGEFHSLARLATADPRVIDGGIYFEMAPRARELLRRSLVGEWLKHVDLVHSAAGRLPDGGAPVGTFAPGGMKAHLNAEAAIRERALLYFADLKGALSDATFSLDILESSSATPRKVEAAQRSIARLFAFPKPFGEVAQTAVENGLGFGQSWADIAWSYMVGVGNRIQGMGRGFKDVAGRYGILTVLALSVGAATLVGIFGSSSRSQNQGPVAA